MKKNTKKEEIIKNFERVKKADLNSVYDDFFSSDTKNSYTKSPTNTIVPDDSTQKNNSGNQINTSNTLNENDFFQENSKVKDSLQSALDALNEFDEKIKSDTAKTLNQNIENLGKLNSYPTNSAQNNSTKNTQNSDGRKNNDNPNITITNNDDDSDPLEELDKLIGLETIKKDVKELSNFVKMNKQRKDMGLKSAPLSLHLCFTGNPGTGKTTVARIIAKLYKNIGVLSNGQLVETDRSGLVAGYVGQTAIKTKAVIDKAIGGVLFIDEAYALSQKDDAFGQEAIDTLLKAMEDNRDDFVVIVAGYSEPMVKFINSNPGLKSRFNKYIEFPDYTGDELFSIFELNCKKYDYKLEEEAKVHVKEIISKRRLENTENFANAREVRNIFEQIITNQANRIASYESPTNDDMMLIKTKDLEELL